MNDLIINTEELEILRNKFKDYISKSIKSQECHDNIGIMVYPNTGRITGGKKINITTVIEDIRTKSERQKVRNKKLLQVGYFSVAGFNGRKEDTNVTKHTGLIPIDIDKKDNQQTDFIELKRDLQSNRYTYACFNSPSGGIKLVINTNISCNEHHDAYYNSICQFLLDHYPVLSKIDTSGSNIARALYLPYDPNAYFNPNAYKYSLNIKQVEEIISVLKLNALRKSSLKVILQVDSISFDKHYDNILDLVKNRTSVGMGKVEDRTTTDITNDNNRTSVGLYDNIFNHYRFNNIDRGVMSTDVPFFELLVLKHLYPYRLDLTTHIDERYFTNTQEPVSAADIDGLDGLEICEVVLPSDYIKVGFRHKTIASMSMKYIFNNPFCHPSLILKKVLWINDNYCEDQNPNNPKPSDEEVMNIVMNNYQKFICGELDFSSVIRKNDKTKKVSKKYVFFSRKYVDICSSYTHLKANKAFQRYKHDKTLRLYSEAVNGLQDGKKITQKRIADHMGMSARNLRRYKTEENLEFFNNYGEVIKRYNETIKMKKH